MSKNFYDILGVPKGSAKDVVSKAYKKLAVKHHPDRGGNAEKMKEINEAWDTLKDDTKRNQYDNGGQNQYGGQSHHAHHGGFSHQFKSQEEMEAYLRQHMYGGRGGHNPWAREPENDDVYIKIKVSLRDVYETTKQTINFNFPGIGKEEISFDIPKGVYNGVQFRVPGKGGQTIKDKPRSDLIVMVYIDMPKDYDVDGYDIMNVAKINVMDIITGTTHKIKFVDGTEIDVKIPQGFEPYKQLRVPNKGLWKNKRERADLKIVVEYDIPKYDLTEQQLQTLEEIKNGK